MQKTDCTTVQLGKGTMRTYEREGIKLHAYQTNDFIDDEVFIVENRGNAFIIEYPCFFDNIKELEGYIADKGLDIKGILMAYHGAGASFLEGTPVYSTAVADEYSHNGGGKALIDNFTAAFGEAFDNSIPTVTNIIEGGKLTLAGIEMNILPNDEAFDIQIPALNAEYIHMMGHDCHSIVAGAGHADAIIGQLQGIKDAGFDLILTSHYTPEDMKDAQAKVDYLSNLKAIAERCSDAAEFKAAVAAEYPEYAGENYLDMTTGFFFAE